MIWHGYIILVVVFSLEAAGQNDQWVNRQNFRGQTSNAQNKPTIDRGPEIEQLKREMEKVSQETDQLNAEKAELGKNIESFKQNCAQELGGLSQQHKSMMQKAEENQKIMVDVLKKIQEEEQEHIRLEQELTRLSEALEIFEYQHEIVYQDLKLMERRRSNGTTDRCKDVTNALAVEAEDALLTRAHLINPYKMRKRDRSDPDNQVIVLTNQYNIKSLLKKKMLSSVESSKRELNNEMEICNAKKSNLNGLIAETNEALKVSAQSMQVLQNDLKASIAFSEAVRLEIKTGKAFLVELREKVDMMKRGIASYNEDNVCFEKIKSVD